jgi:hypothetical protein
LRLHPALLKEKIDSTEKQSQKQPIDDVSREWRQYCLDPICTNYSQIIQNMLATSTLNKISPQNRTQKSITNKTSVSSSAGSSLALSIHQQQSQNSVESTLVAQSPSYLFINSNRTSCKIKLTIKR